MPPKTDIQNQEIRKKSKQKIIDAATKLFAESGFSGTPISAIAKEAGISKGLIYNYFETKEDIVKGIFEVSISSTQKNVKEDIAKIFESGSAYDIVCYFLDEIVTIFTEQEEKMRILTMFSLKMKDFPYIHDISVQSYTEYLKLFTAVFEKDKYKEPRKEALLLVNHLTGIKIQYLFIDKELFDINEVCNAIKEIYKK